MLVLWLLLLIIELLLLPLCIEKLFKLVFKCKQVERGLVSFIDPKFLGDKSSFFFVKRGPIFCTEMNWKLLKIKNLLLEFASNSQENLFPLISFCSYLKSAKNFKRQTKFDSLLFWDGKRDLMKKREPIHFLKKKERWFLIFKLFIKIFQKYQIHYFQLFHLFVFLFKLLQSIKLTLFFIKILQEYQNCEKIYF